MLDNCYDPDIAIQDAEEFVDKGVDLVLEFQVEEAVAPRMAHIFKKANIPLIAFDVPHPNATYFGVDNRTTTCAIVLSSRNPGSQQAAPSAIHPEQAKEEPIIL